MIANHEARQSLDTLTTPRRPSSHARRGSGVIPEVIAAHGAGHAVAVIVFGGTFTGIRLTQHGGAAAQTLNIGGLSEIGYARSFLAGTAEEEVALDTSDPRNTEMDHCLMMRAISDYTVLAHATTRANEVIVKYQAAHDAVRQLIFDPLASGTTEVIAAERLIAVAAAHGARARGRRTWIVGNEA